MKNVLYEVRIPVSKYINDAAAIGVNFDTYEEATEFAKPIIKQHGQVIIEEIEGEPYEECIEIPLDTYDYIENLTDVVKIATEKIIARIKEHAKNDE